MVLSATSLPVNVSFARYTVPVAPLPSIFWMSYFPTLRSRSRVKAGAAAGLESGIDIARLHRGVELDRIAALLARPVARAFAAAERHVVVDARGRQVHHHHARGGIALEVLGVLERSGRDARGKPE